MKKPFLISLAVLLLLFSATVCQANGSESDTYQPVGDQMPYDFSDETYGDASIRNGKMRFHNFIVGIYRDLTRIGNIEFHDFDDGTSTRIGCMILYNFDW